MNRLPLLLLLMLAVSCAHTVQPVAPPRFTQCFSLDQRRYVVLEKLPQVRIGLGDITGGHVVASVLVLESGSILVQQTMRPYDHLEFVQAGVTYYLQLVQLHDMFMSTDTADLLLTTDPDALRPKPDEPSAESR